MISSQQGGPFAYRTKLGWCVVGPVEDVKTPNKFSCHKVSMITAGFKAISNDVKDISIQKMWHKMNEDEKLCNQLNLIDQYDLEEVSQNDMKFLEIVDKETQKVDGHYEVPLPFMKDDVVLPDNKWIALKRAESLRRKFLKDPCFHKEYTDFMNNILDKGWASPVTSKHPPGKSWFIPHHGVKHPTKKKIRVVFDCTSEVKGESLNKNLLQGPDLTNQLVGVLTRFREEKVAFSGDIESMFFQVSIPKCQRSYMQFLWWPEGNLSHDLKEYEMGRHIQGGTSSPGVLISH